MCFSTYYYDHDYYDHDVVYRSCFIPDGSSMLARRLHGTTEDNMDRRPRTIWTTQRTHIGNTVTFTLFAGCILPQCSIADVLALAGVCRQWRIWARSAHDLLIQRAYKTIVLNTDKSMPLVSRQLSHEKCWVQRAIAHGSLSQRLERMSPTSFDYARISADVNGIALSNDAKHVYVFCDNGKRCLMMPVASRGAKGKRISVPGFRRDGAIELGSWGDDGVVAAGRDRRTRGSLIAMNSNGTVIDKTGQLDIEHSPLGVFNGESRLLYGTWNGYLILHDVNTWQRLNMAPCNNFLDVNVDTFGGHSHVVALSSRELPELAIVDMRIANDINMIRVTHPYYTMDPRNRGCTADTFIPPGLDSYLDSYRDVWRPLFVGHVLTQRGYGFELEYDLRNTKHATRHIMHEDELKIGAWYRDHTRTGASMPVVDPYTGYMVYGELKVSSKASRNVGLEVLRQEATRWPRLQHHADSIRIPREGAPVWTYKSFAEGYDNCLHYDMKQGVLAFCSTYGHPIVMDFN